MADITCKDLLYDPVEIERWLERDTMRKLDLHEHWRIMGELDKIADVLDTVPIQPWEMKVSRRLKVKTFWV